MITDEQIRAVAQAIADELMRQEGSIDPPYPALPDDMELDYIDQGRVDMGAVARAAIGRGNWRPDQWLGYAKDE